MKRLFALSLVAASLAVAGPLKVATFPGLHPVKTVKALKKGIKGIVKAGKTLLW